MIVAVSGTHHKLVDEERSYAWSVMMAKLANPRIKEWRTGAAEGIDTIAAKYAYNYRPDIKHTIVVPSAWHNEKFVRQMSPLAGIEIVYMPAVVDEPDPRKRNAKAYRQRNVEMVAPAHQLIAFPTSMGNKRSGTWMTIRIAQELHKNVFVFPLKLEERLPRLAGHHV
jgi:predicted Rossmann fold nucleotide-binding protein DprA/Smf involved in DNA uptake